MTYQLEDVPVADVGSRFALPQTPAGFDTSPDEAVGAAFQSLVGSRRSTMQPVTPEAITIPLKIAVKVAGEWQLQDRGQVVKVPTLQSCRPGKRIGVAPSGEVLDSLALGHSPGWTEAPDDLIWKSMLVVCRELDLEGAGWRQTVDSVARLVCLRAGVEVAEDQLPPVSVMQRTVTG
jgi:hypothetical protein